MSTCERTLRGYKRDPVTPMVIFWSVHHTVGAAVLTCLIFLLAGIIFSHYGPGESCHIAMIKMFRHLRPFSLYTVKLVLSRDSL